MNFAVRAAWHTSSASPMTMSSRPSSFVVRAARNAALFAVNPVRLTPGAGGASRTAPPSSAVAPASAVRRHRECARMSRSTKATPRSSKPQRRHRGGSKTDQEGSCAPPQHGTCRTTETGKHAIPGPHACMPTAQLRAVRITPRSACTPSPAHGRAVALRSCARRTNTDPCRRSVRRRRGRRRGYRAWRRRPHLPR